MPNPTTPSQVFSAEQMQATVRMAGAGVGDSDLELPLRFYRACFRRLKRAVPPTGLPIADATFAVFVLREDQARREDFDRSHYLHRANTALTGRIWLTNPLFNAGDFQDHSHKEIEAVIAALDALGLSHRPTVIVDLATKDGEIRYYPHGTNVFDDVQVANLADPEEVSCDDALAVIDVVYRASLITPQHQINGASIWANAQKWWVSQNAEGEIQSQIRAGLSVRFPGSHIEHEGTVDTGRFDLRIGWFNETKSSYSYDGVLELKVLKSLSNTGRTPYDLTDNQGWLSKGLVQAHTYRENSNADWSSLVAFDARKGEADDSCFDHLLEEAVTKHVVLRRWRLYNEVEKHRDVESAKLVGAPQDN